MECDTCSLTFQEVTSQLTEKDEQAIDFFFKSTVFFHIQDIMETVENRANWGKTYVFMCDRQKTNSKNKRVVRGFFPCSLLNGSWLDKAHLSPSIPLLFINIYLRKYFSQLYCLDNLKLFSPTTVDWRNFCEEVCERWMMKRQLAIGGSGVVEMDERKFGKRKYNKGQWGGVRGFGGIERGTKAIFAVPVPNKEAATLV